MLFNLEPDTSVTGGAWYSDQDFESEFVEVLNQQCYRCLLQKVISYSTAIDSIYLNFVISHKQRVTHSTYL